MIQLLHDHSCHGIVIVQNVLVPRDVLQRLFVLPAERFNFQTDQTVEPHLQDSRRLALREPEHRRHLL